MLHSLRPLAIAVGMALACSAHAAKPAKTVEKPAPAPAAAVDAYLAHNLGPTGEAQLQAVVDRFNAEQGGNLKLKRLEKGEAPAGLNLVRRYDMSDVLSNAKAFVPLQEMMAKGAKVNRTPDIAAFRKSVESVYARAREKFGAADVDQVLAETEAVRKSVR